MTHKEQSATTAQTVNEYMGLPYRIEMVPDEGGWFVAIPELPGCLSQGETPEEALEMIRDAQRLWLEVALEAGHPIPVPADQVESAYSGKFNVRIPKVLHRDLVRTAEAEGVSLNLFVATALAQAVNPRVIPRPRPLTARTQHYSSGKSSTARK